MPQSKYIQKLLGSLLLFVAINAFGGGFYGMLGANEIPTDLLKNSPFDTYFIPSLILFLFIGGSSFSASIAVFKRIVIARKLAFISGSILLIWLAVQIAIIGYISWLQPTMAVIGLTILFLTWKIQKP